MINIELNKKVIESIKELKKQIILDTCFPVYETYVNICYKDDIIKGILLEMHLDESIESIQNLKSKEKIRNLIKICGENDIYFRYNALTNFGETVIYCCDVSDPVEKGSVKESVIENYDWNALLSIEYSEDGCNLEEEESYIHTLSIDANSEEPEILNEDIEKLKEILEQENMLNYTRGEEEINLNWENKFKGDS